MYNHNMFVIPPTDWKYMRRLFTPTFSSAKLKVMVRKNIQRKVFLKRVLHQVLNLTFNCVFIFYPYT